MGPMALDGPGREGDNDAMSDNAPRPTALIERLAAMPRTDLLAYCDSIRARPGAQQPLMPCGAEVLSEARFGRPASESWVARGLSSR
jgi:hypothetical protein